MSIRRWIVLILCCVIAFTSAAQYKVRLLIRHLPPKHPAGQRIFVAGPFNNWQPGSLQLSVSPDSLRHGITIAHGGGKMAFKFTRGSWATVETDKEGNDIQNRQVEINSDTSIDLSIEQWKDHTNKKPQGTTAGKNVHIVDTAFFMPQLNRYRRIWIYLPADYATTRKKYPVLYMHDGQNVFDAATSFSGEWGVDEALDTLRKDLIVVAVDNGGEHRMHEYCPYDMKYGKGEGDAYVDFLVQTLKPHIEKHYRVKKSAKDNFIAGSSLGGLISFYALLKYPNKFGGAGIFSPAFWINPEFKNIDSRKLKKIKGKVYFFAGQQEGEEMVPDMLGVLEQLKQHSKAETQTVIRAEGTHSEGTWRHEFPNFVQWLIPLSP
jgi:predicted alpha/beta superfamily hydrolase